MITEIILNLIEIGRSKTTMSKAINTMIIFRFNEIAWLSSSAFTDQYLLEFLFNLTISDAFCIINTPLSLIDPGMKSLIYNLNLDIIYL